MDLRTDVQQNAPTGWLKPAPGQTPPVDPATRMAQQRQAAQKRQQQLDQLHTVAKDVAANLNEQAYNEAKRAQFDQRPDISGLSLEQYNQALVGKGPNAIQPIQFKTQGESLWDKVKQTYQSVAGTTIAGTAGQYAATALGKDTAAPLQRDTLDKAAYLPDQYKYQNTEIALGRALAAHPELITKPYLLMTAALSDMQAHDIKYLATMDDMMKIYSTSVMSKDGLQNAANSMIERMQNTPQAQNLQGIGNAVGKTVSFVGDLQRDLEKIAAEAAGRTVKSVGAQAGQPAAIEISGGSGAGSAIFGGAQTAGNVLSGIWNATGENLFGIQHAIRTESDIRRTQGDAAANEYLGTWFSTAVLLNYAGKGFALALKGVEKAGLKSMLEKVGMSGLDGASLTQLHLLAQGANIGDKRWIRLIQASQDWLMHQPQNVRLPLLSAYARKGMSVAEDASGAERTAAWLSRNLTPTGKILKDAATYGARHYHIPLNLELAAQLVNTTNGFGVGHEWDKSWERTADGTKYKDPITHAPISFGREVASAVGLEPNTWWYNMVSGPLDFLSWFEMDPFQSVLAPISEAKQLENNGLLKRVYGGIGIRSATDVYNLEARSPKFRAFIDKVVDVNKEAIPHRLETAEQFKKTRLEKIARETAKLKKQGLTQAQIDVRLAAKKINPLTDEEAASAAMRANPKASSVARLYKLFPELSHAVRPSELENGDNFMQLLSHVHSHDEAVDLFASVAQAHQYLNTYRAPSYSRFMSAKDWARVQVANSLEKKADQLIMEGRYADAAKVGIDSKFYRMFTSLKPVMWDDFRKFSNQVVRIGDPKSLDMMSRAFRASGVNPLTVDLLINRLAMSKSAQEWKTVYWNWARDTFHLYVESHLQELVVKTELTPKQATKARNILSAEFGHAAEELGNPFGGGGSRNFYSGANVNNIVDAERPFPSGGAMSDTAGLGSMHEHYLPLFDYNTLDNLVRDLGKYLKSPDGRKHIINQVNETIAAPLNAKIADVQKQMKAIEENYAKMTTTVPMRNFQAETYPLPARAQEHVDRVNQYISEGGISKVINGEDDKLNELKQSVVNFMEASYASGKEENARQYLEQLNQHFVLDEVTPRAAKKFGEIFDDFVTNYPARPKVVVYNKEGRISAFGIPWAQDETINVHHDWVAPNELGAKYLLLDETAKEAYKRLGVVESATGRMDNGIWADFNPVLENYPQIATREIKDTTLNAIPYDTSEKIKWVYSSDAKAWVNHVQSEADRYENLTAAEKELGIEWTKHQRFLTASTNDGKKFYQGFQSFSNIDASEGAVHDIYKFISELDNDLKRETTNALEKAFSDFTPKEISNGFDDAIEYLFNHYNKLENGVAADEFDAHNFVSDLSTFFRHSDHDSSYEAVLNVMPDSVLDILLSMNEAIEEANSLLAGSAAIAKYTKSSQRERAWLRSFTLDQQYQGLRHSLGEINRKELTEFKKFASTMDSVMEPIDREIRVVRVLNPDQVADGRTYSSGMGDFPGSVSPLREYVAPLPFTVDVSTGFVRPMAIDEVRPGAVLNDPSYQSTAFGKYFGLNSQDYNTVMSLETAIQKDVKITHTAIHYTIPPGISGVDARPLSVNASEREFILQRGLTSVVIDTEVVKAGTHADTGVLNIYAAILPQGAQEAPMKVYMRNRQAIEDMAFNKLMDGSHNWADVLKDVEASDLRREKERAIRERTPEQRKLRASGAEKGIIDRLRMDIQRRGETEGLSYEQVDVINDFLNLVGKDMFKGVRINTISRAKAGLANETMADYDFGSKMMNLFAGAVLNEGVDRAFLHEAWHHLSSFLHPEEVTKFSDEMMKARTRFMRANTFKGYLETLDEETIRNLEMMKKNGSTAAAKELQGINYMKQLVAKGLHKSAKNVIWDSLPGAYRGGLENYRLESVDEWFAETMYDRTRKRMATDNPIIEWMYQMIGKVLRGINKLSGAANSRRVFDDFIQHRYDASQATQLPMAMRSAGTNALVTKARMAQSPHLSDPAWQALKEQEQTFRQERSDLISAATGDYKFYDLKDAARMTASNGLHTAHTVVRQRLIDDYFRKMSLSTGSFSMRVSASEAIPNAFRVGVGNYTKNALFGHVERAVKQYEKDYKRPVSRDEMGVIQKWVYDRLSKLTKEDLKFYGTNLPSEVKRYARRLERDFAKGLVSGEAFDKFVERMTKDFLYNGYTLGGLSADHADIYSGGRDAIGGQFRNLANGYGTGPWMQSGEMNTDTLAGLGKIWQDITHDSLQRTTAKILDDYLNPANFRGSSFEERLAAATEEVNKVTKQMVRKNPAMFDNMDRAAKGKMLESTRDRIANEILVENGLPVGTPIRGRLLDELKDRLQKVDSLEEWASANIQHILWASHGRGSSGGFSFPNMGDRVFHRRVLTMLGKGEAPEKVNEVEKLILTPDEEHARVLNRMKWSAKEDITIPKAKSNKGGESARYHEILYHPSATYHDASTYNAAMEGGLGLDDLMTKLRPKPVSKLSRASSRRATVKGLGINQRYSDSSGRVHSLFPDNIPIQKGSGYDAPNFIDRFSDRVHDTVSRRVIDSVARRPLYAVELNAQLDFLEPLVKSKAITEDLAFSIAQSRAINEGIKYVHNPQDRMLFEQWSRAYAPFWFAQNQALRRMGRMALQNPAAFESYMKLQLMFMQSGKASTENIDSQHALLLPGSMLGGRAFTSFLKTFGLSPSGNVPIGLTGSLTSLNSVFPWNDPSGLHTGSPVAMLDHLRPQFGPLVSVPMQLLETISPYGFNVPKTDIHISPRKLSETALGDVGSNVGTMHSVIPNPAIRSFLGTAASILSGGRNVDSELTTQIASIQYGLIPQYYADKSNEIIDKARAQAKRDWAENYGMEMAATDPAGYKKYLDAQTLSYTLNGYEDKNNPNRGFKGLTEYWSDPTARSGLIQDTAIAANIIYLGRTAISFFSPLSTQTTQVQPELQKFIHDLYNTKGETSKVLDLLGKHPETIAFLEARQSASTLGIPLDASINMGIFQEQNKDLFQNNKLTAGVAMLLPYHKQGSERDSHVYNIQKHKGLRSKYTPDDYIKNIARDTGNFYAYELLPKMTQELYGGDDSVQRQLVAEHAKKNRAWYDSLGEGKNHRQAAFESLVNVLNVKGVEKRPGLKETVPMARQLIRDYRDYQQRLAQAMPGNYSVIQGEWQQHVDSFKKQHPVSSVLVDSLFKNLSLRDVR